MNEYLNMESPIILGDEAHQRVPPMGELKPWAFERPNVGLSMHKQLDVTNSSFRYIFKLVE